MTERPERVFLTRYHARWVVPVSHPPVEDGTVVVEGDRIAYVGPRSGAPRGRDVELGDAILLPGLVNAHTHLDLTALRGLLDGLPFFSWVRTLVAARHEVLVAADLLDGARLGVLEGLRAGITTFADTSPADAAFDAMCELGVRGIAYREVFGPDPGQCASSMDELRAAVAAMRLRETPLVRAGVSPHAPYSVSDALFAAAAVYAREESLPLATHVAESEDESRFVTRGDGPFATLLRERGIPVAPRGRSPVALLERCGVLAPGTLLIHCVRADADDVDTIAQHGAAVAHCPASNAWFGHGTAPLTELLGARVRVGLGSDSMVSNTRMDVLMEARLAMDAQRERGRTRFDATRALELATLGGARALGLDAEIGSLDTGKQADLAVFALPTAGRTTRRPEEVLLGNTDSALLVVVGGRELVREGRVVGADTRSIADRVTASATRLSDWMRAR
ncbi:MAG: amidohydrolase family protein [Gemmatimonadales bacterium]